MGMITHYKIFYETLYDGSTDYVYRATPVTYIYATSVMEAIEKFYKAPPERGAFIILILNNFNQVVFTLNTVREKNKLIKEIKDNEFNETRF